MNRSLRLLTGVLAICLIGVSGYRLLGIYTDYAAGTDLYNRVAQQAAARTPASPNGQTVGEAPPEALPISIDFEALCRTNPDIVGWIYCPDTILHYPVVQAEDNDYYLRRMVDGSDNSSGSIFLDCRNSGDFGDPTSILHGHNMKNDAMFGTLPNYSDPGYYERHPTLWLMTPSATCRIDLFAGFVTPADSPFYRLHEDETPWRELLRQAAAQSDFEAKIDLDTVEQAILLSTCSYQYRDARYILLGSLTPWEEHPDPRQEPARTRSS